MTMDCTEQFLEQTANDYDITISEVKSIKRDSASFAEFYEILEDYLKHKF